MGTQLIKCGITQQVIQGQEVQVFFITSGQEVHNVWDNNDGQATKVPFTSNKMLDGFFQAVSLPIKGSFDDYQNFALTQEQNNVIPCFMLLRNIYGTHGYQSSFFQIKTFILQFPNISKIFNSGLFELEELENFQHWEELFTCMEKLCHEIMFNNVSIYNSSNVKISQVHLSVMLDVVYRELVSNYLPQSTFPHLRNSTFNYYSYITHIDHIFQEVNTYLKNYNNPNSRIYFNDCFYAFINLSHCKIPLTPIVSARQDYDNSMGSFFNKLTTIAQESVNTEQSSL